MSNQRNLGQIMKQSLGKVFRAPTTKLPSPLSADALLSGYTQKLGHRSSVTLDIAQFGAAKDLETVLRFLGPPVAAAHSIDDQDLFMAALLSKSPAKVKLVLDSAWSPVFGLKPPSPAPGPSTSRLRARSSSGRSRSSRRRHARQAPPPPPPSVSATIIDSDLAAKPSPLIQLFETLHELDVDSEWRQGLARIITSELLSARWPLDVFTPRPGGHVRTHLVHWMLTCAPAFPSNDMLALIDRIEPITLWDTPDHQGRAPLSLLVAMPHTASTLTLVNALLDAGAEPWGKAPNGEYNHVATLHVDNNHVLHQTPPLHSLLSHPYVPGVSMDILDRILLAGGSWNELDPERRTAVSTMFSSDVLGWIEATALAHPEAFASPSHNLLPFVTVQRMESDTQQRWEGRMRALSLLAVAAPVHFKTLVTELSAGAKAAVDRRLLDVLKALQWTPVHDPSAEQVFLTLTRTKCRLCVEYLLDTWEMDPNMRNEFGETPLHGAAAVGDADMILTLLRHGADLEVRSDVTNVTPDAVAKSSPNPGGLTVLRVLEHSVMVQAPVGGAGLKAIAMPMVSGVVRDVALGTSLTVLVTTSGKLYKHDAVLDKLEPLYVRPLESLVAGKGWWAGIDSEGSVWIGGRLAKTGFRRLMERELGFRGRFVALSGSGSVMVGLDVDGALWCLGDHIAGAGRVFGINGGPATVVVTRMVETPALPPFSMVALSGSVLAAVTRDSGSLYMWGGDTPAAPKQVPASKLRDGDMPMALAAGDGFVVLLWGDGQMLVVDYATGKVRPVGLQTQVPLVQIAVDGTALHALTALGDVHMGTVKDGAVSLGTVMECNLRRTPEAGIYGPARLERLAAGGSRVLAWTGGASTLGKALMGVRKQVVAMDPADRAEMSDMVLESTDGARAWVHRSLLGLRAPVFLAALQGKAAMRMDGGLAVAPLPLNRRCLKVLLTALYSDFEIPACAFSKEAEGMPLSLAPLRAMLGERAALDLTGTLSQAVDEYATKLYWESLKEGVRPVSPSPEQRGSRSRSGSAGRLKDWIVGRLRSGSRGAYESSSDFHLSTPSSLIKVHRLVLAARSPVFGRLMSGPWKEAQERSVEMVGEEAGLPAPVVGRVMHWMYTGEVPNVLGMRTLGLEYDEAMGVMYLANMYGLEELQTHMAEVIGNRLLCPGNAANVWAWSQLMDLDGLRTSSEYIIRAHKEEVMQSESFQALPAEQQDFLASGMFAPIPPPPPLPPMAPRRANARA